jgi:hypothetical protein
MTALGATNPTNRIYFQRRPLKNSLESLSQSQYIIVFCAAKINVKILFVSSFVILLGEAQKLCIKKHR